MTEDTSGESGREQKLHAVLAAYYEATERGDDPDRRILFDRHPNLAVELADFFAVQDEIHHMAVPLRAVVSDGRTGRDQSELNPIEHLFMASAVASSGPEESLRFGDYELQGVIARGGMGVVFRARQRSLNRLVAVKVIRDGARASADDARRFRNEAEAVAHLDHPHIVPIHEVGEERGCSFFSMKIVEGGNLAERLEEYYGDPRAAAALVSTVARAVQHAHERGILHRDLKPSNILIDERGQPLVADFGLARRVEADSTLTQTGAVLGTPSYMAPEQATGRSATVTTATDIHGLGAILYAILTGRPPFRGETPLETLQQVKEKTPEPPSAIRRSIDRDLETICLKCLEKDPQSRYESAIAVAEDLERWLDGRTIVARPAGRAERAWRWCRRNSRVTALAAAAIILMATSAVGLVVGTKGNLAAARLNQVVRVKEQSVRRQEYLRDVKLASQLWADNRSSEALRLLERYVPASGEEDLRHYPWHYFHRLCTLGKPPLVGHRGDVYFVAFSPDGKTLATAGKDGTGRVWDLARRTTLVTLTGHADEINWVSFSPDGKSLATASDDGTAQLWDRATGRAKATLSGDREQVLAALFTPDGRLVISCSRKGRVWFWDAATHEQCGSFAVSNNLLHSLAISPDGSTLAISGRDLVIWDVVGQRERLRLRSDSKSEFVGVAFSHDGRSLAAGLSDRVIVYDSSSGNVKETFLGHVRTVESVAFSHDDRLLAVSGHWGFIQLWDRATGASDLIASNQARMWSVAFSPDDCSLATSSTDGTVKLWDAVADRAWIPIASHSTADKLSMAFSSDGLRFVVSALGDVRTYDSRTGRAISTATLDPGSTIHCSTLSDDAASLAVSDESGTISLWEVASERRLRQWPAPSVKAAYPATVSLRTGNVAGVTLDGKPFVTGPAGCSLSNPPVDALDRLEFLPDGECTTWGKNSMAPLLWHTVTGRYRRPTHAGHRQCISSEALSPDGRILATASFDGTVILWDRESLDYISQFYGHSAAPVSVVFSPDGRILATGCADGLIRLWDIAAGVEIASLAGHSVQVLYLAFSPDGLTLASACPMNGGGFDVMLWPALPIESATQTNKSTLRRDLSRNSKNPR
jgi:eukaryotic-like serine/threonine-protein kinase